LNKASALTAGLQILLPLYYFLKTSFGGPVILSQVILSSNHIVIIKTS